MNMTIGQWYIGSCSSTSYEPIVVVPTGPQKNGAIAAVFYDFDRRKAYSGSTRGLNLLGWRETNPDRIRSAFRKEGEKCVARVAARLPGATALDRWNAFKDPKRG